MESNTDKWLDSPINLVQFFCGKRSRVARPDNIATGQIADGSAQQRWS